MINESTKRKATLSELKVAITDKSFYLVRNHHMFCH